MPSNVDATVSDSVAPSSADHLAKKGRSIAVVEKGQIIAEWSSGNWGWCQQQNRDALELPPAHHSLALWAQLAAETGVDLGLRRTGLLSVADRPKNLAAWERWSDILLVASCPGLAGIRMSHVWGGRIDSRPDAMPVISAVPGWPGLFLSTEFSGHGFQIGPGAGRLAADLVAGDAPVVDPAPFRFARLKDGSALPPTAM